MHVKINWPRAKQICGQLLTARREREYPYDQVLALPQNFIPAAVKNDSLVHARLLFYSCHYMRGTIKSDHAVRQLIALHSSHPELFDPHVAMQPAALPVLKQELGELLGYKTEEMARFWQENSRRLVAHWGGDPRMIFATAQSAELMYLFITNKKPKYVDPLDPRTKGFLGFQEKMASMLAYFLIDAGLAPSLAASPPVDFHLLRVMLASGMLTVTLDREDERVRYEHLTPHGRTVLNRYVREFEASLVEVGDAFWMLSVVLCSQAPGNRSSGRKKGVYGKKGRPVRVTVDWRNPKHRQAYLRSCDACPLNTVCTLNVPAGPYYQTGEFDMGVRLRPTSKDLHPLLGADLPIQLKPQVVLAPRPIQRIRKSGVLFADLPNVRRPPKEL